MSSQAEGAGRFGRAHGGTRVFFLERLTSALLIPLILFLIGLALALASADHATTIDVLSRPLVAVPLLLFIVVNAVHMQLGMRAIIEDYVHHRIWSKLCLAGNAAMVWIASGLSVYAVLRLSFGG